MKICSFLRLFLETVSPRQVGHGAVCRCLHLRCDRWNADVVPRSHRRLGNTYLGGHLVPVLVLLLLEGRRLLALRELLLLLLEGGRMLALRELRLLLLLRRVHRVGANARG